LHVGDRVVPAPNRACGECEFCRGDFPYYFCRRLENYGNSLTCSESPHLFGGWAEYLYLRPRTPVFKVPDDLPTDVAVLTELFAVTHSLDLAAKMPRPGGFRDGDTVAVVGIGPVGSCHVAKASLMGASRVIAIDPFGPASHWRSTSGDRLARRQWRRPIRRSVRRELTSGRGVDVSSTPPALRPASARRWNCCATAAR
jgi:L-iditol 2-dehydrogenase